jgi:hypothetical protein
MTEYSESHRHREEYSFRHHTGAVGLIFLGERPRPKSGAEIRDIASKTEFFEEGRFRAQYAGGTIEYMPRTLVSEGIAEALAHGLLLYKFQIGDDPPIMFRSLDPGEYYTYVDFIEGPDFKQGRWVGRIVNSLGRVACTVVGIEAKQLGDFHMDHREDHSKPQIDIHGVAAEESPAEESFAAAIFWADVQISWTQYDTFGCRKDLVCVPQEQ